MNTDNTIDFGLNLWLDANSIGESFYRAMKTNKWKHMTQAFQVNFMKSIYHLQYQLMCDEYVQQPFYEFDISERGKARHIRAQVIQDRVVQRDVSDNVILPSITPYLIYDNGSSLKTKGINFARKRLVHHLTEYIKENGIEGYILQIDFKKFFDSIPHDELIDSFEKVIKDKKVMRIIIQMIRAFSNEEFDGVSLGIGSQVSQNAGVYYPTPIDNYCKIVRGMKYYARYMDDIYIIHKDKAVLESILNGVCEIARKQKLTIHPNKTHITSLRKGFTFMKIKYNITESGKIIKRIIPKTITRERIRLKKYYKKYMEGKMSYYEIENNFKSWYGNYRKFDSRKSVHEVLRLFIILFKDDIRMYTKDQKLYDLTYTTSDKYHLRDQTQRDANLL